MPKAKVVSVEEVEAPVEEAEVEVASTPKRGEKIDLSVEYLVVDQEGIKERKSLETSGNSVKEVLEGITLPAGFNKNLIVRVSRGERNYEINIPQHKVRALFVDKDTIAFKSVFGF